MRVVDVLGLQFGRHCDSATLLSTSQRRQISGDESFVEFVLGLFKGDRHFSARTDFVTATVNVEGV